MSRNIATLERQRVTCLAGAFDAALRGDRAEAQRLADWARYYADKLDAAEAAAAAEEGGPR